MKLKTALSVLSLLFFTGLSFSDGDELAQKAMRIDKSPVLDGRLLEDAWKQATPFTGFTMVFPNPGSEPTEKTELRILYDETNLYIGVYCFDTEPSRISANSMDHDAGGDHGESGDDIVKILLDPFQDKRNAYIFFVNPRSARSEGLAFGEHFSLNWDGIWDAKSRILSDGWSCEMKIPFKTISFNPGLASWGINVERYIPRKQETIRLSGTRRDSFFYNAVEAAVLEGIGGIKQGLGITFRPYGIVVRYQDHVASAAADGKLDGGFDLYKNFTPNFVGAVSFNTDFAETEVDERRLNLTRFPLYFPEKRTFFLEGSEIFNFAGQTGGGYGGPSFVPFFSRRIGLYEEERVPVASGAKIFGKLGNMNISLLDVRTREFTARDDVPLAGQNFVAGRVYQNIWDESKVGFLFTNGSPDGSKNTLAGFDLICQTSRFRGDQNFSATGWYVYNWNGIKTGNHQGFGLKLDYPNDLWDCAATYAYYGDALDPGLGFLPRPGVQNVNLGFNYRPRPEKGFVGRLIRQFFYELRFTFYWDLKGNLETRRVFTAPLNIRTESGEHIEFNIVPNRDVLPYDFEVGDGVVLPKGQYDFTNYTVHLSTAGHRAWAINLEYKFGPFYSGQYNDAEIGLDLKFKGYATLNVGANIVRGNLPQGRFKENVYELKADFFLSPNLGLMNYFQYDDVSKNFGVNIRFRWRILPGNEIYLIYTKNWERRWDPESRFIPLGERGVFKITLSVRP